MRCEPAISSFAQISGETPLLLLRRPINSAPLPKLWRHRGDAESFGRKCGETRGARAHWRGWVWC